MNAYMTKDEQFAAALMLLGDLPNIRLNLIPHAPAKLGDATPVSYPEFVAYKTSVIELLKEADMFDVYYLVPGVRDDPNVHEQLTEKASLWIGEYFQWMASEQAQRAT